MTGGLISGSKRSWALPSFTLINSLFQADAERQRDVLSTCLILEPTSSVQVPNAATVDEVLCGNTDLAALRDLNITG